VKNIGKDFWMEHTQYWFARTSHQEDLTPPW
jgi:hypothetical protein